ncbi:class I SAM-dependent methyltransferase [Candidatus Dependentiae bacterium]|nr:class I SAM-dependent methyltransferase [Candidatus Dependentiae bacterium]
MKRKLNCLFVINLLIFAQVFPKKAIDLPSPYCDLKEVLPFNGHGWYTNGVWIEKLMKQNKIYTVIEVGSWLGASTRHIASLLQANGKLYAVDTWEGSVEHYENQEWKKMLPTLYEQFLSNIVHAQLTDRIIPVKSTSINAALDLKNQINKVDLIFIDAGHDTESVLNDLVIYWPFVQNNEGVLCGDDWYWESVRKAVIIFAKNYKLTLYADDNFWFLKKEDDFNLKSFKTSSNDVWIFDRLQ